MEMTRFEEILDFAIGRELAAVDFYTELLAIASFAAQKSVLTDFRAMEEGHATMLTNMKSRHTVYLSDTPAVDLGLARRLAAEEKPAAGMDFQDILVAAIGKEDRAGSLYAELASSSSDAEIKSAFGSLAAEETRHKRYFEELYETEVARDN